MHVIDVFESGDNPENDSRTAILWKQTDMEGGQYWYGAEFLMKAERTCMR